MFHFAQDYIYVSSISDITDPFRSRIEPGKYLCGTLDGRQGFVFGIENKVINNKNLFKIYATRNGYSGLSNTYHGGEIKDKAVLKIVCDNFLKHISVDTLYDLYNNNTNTEIEFTQFQQYTESDLKALFMKDGFCEYNNLPILLFLNKVLQNKDLDKLQFLECDYVDEETYWHRVYNVILEGVSIGALVHSSEFYNMSGDQMGLAAYSEDNLHMYAFANFDAQTEKEWDKIDNLRGAYDPLPEEHVQESDLLIQQQKTFNYIL